MDDITQRVGEHLNKVMTSRRLKLEYVAAASGVAVETVRRVKHGQVTRLRDETAHKLGVFLEAATHVTRFVYGGVVGRWGR
jgi:DNA-binding Xre family transcriptional regulator